MFKNGDGEHAEEEE